jgi:hypothetical protein
MPSDSTDTKHMAASEQWNVYESNVQSYRNMALSSQGLFLAAGAVLLDPLSMLPFFGVMAIALIAQWFIWFPVIFARTAIVDYYKFNFADLYDVEGNPRKRKTASRLSERDYAKVTNFELRKKIYQQRTFENGEAFRTMRVSRSKIDLYLPVLVSVLWFYLAIVGITS